MSFKKELMYSLSHLLGAVHGNAYLFITAKEEVSEKFSDVTFCKDYRSNSKGVQ